MQYINKNDAINQAKGQRIIGEMIDCSWDDVYSRHVNLIGMIVVLM